MRRGIFMLLALSGLVSAGAGSAEPVDVTRSPVAISRTNALAAAIQPYLSAAQADLAAKTRAQSIKGIAVARAGVAVFQDALDELARTGSVRLPERPRRELAESVAACAAALGAIESDFSNRLARARESRPTEAVQSGEDPADAPGSAAAASAAVLPEFFASRGTGDEWVVVGRWKAEMMAVDVVPVPVTGRSGRDESMRPSPLGVADSRLVFEGERMLPRSAAAAYRLRRLPGHEPVDVVEWPGPDNGYTLLVRTHQSRTIPFVHGFELQASLPSKDWAAAPANAAGDRPDAPRGESVLSITTEPKGARVYIDDVMRRDGRGDPVRTPCQIRVPAAACTVRLALAGYLDVAATNLDVRQDRTLSWRFREDPRVIRKTVSVEAKGKWLAAGVRVAKGDRVILRPSGTWVCGSRGDECGPDGYTNDLPHAHYYATPEASPRQAPDVNYGALIYKVSPHSYPRSAGVATTFVADEDAQLLFDINELADPALRRDNRGRVQVEIMVLPGAR